MAKINIGGGNNSNILKAPNVLNKATTLNPVAKKVPDSGIAGLASTQPSKAVTTAPGQPQQSQNTGSWLDPNTSKAATGRSAPTQAKTYDDVKPMQDDAWVVDDIVNWFGSGIDYLMGGQENRDQAARQADIDRMTSREPKVLSVTQADIDRLGLPQDYLGYQYSRGYVDADGKYVEQENLQHLVDRQVKLKRMADEGPDLTNLAETSQFQQLEDLSAGMASGQFVEEDRARAQADFEQRMGLDFTDEASGMLQDLQRGVDNREGMSDVDKANFNRQTQQIIQNMRDESTQMLEALGSSGRNVAGYQFMKERSQAMTTYAGQRHEALVERDQIMKKTEYEALKDRYDKLYEMEQISASQYTQALQQDRMNAVQSLATQINFMAMQNEQDAKAYSDLFNRGMAAIQMDMGVSQHNINMAAAQYEMDLAPMVAEYNLAAQNAARTASEYESKIAPIMKAAELAVHIVSAVATGGSSIPASLTTMLSGLGGGGEKADPSLFNWGQQAPRSGVEAGYYNTGADY